jgi:hypothetical protein
VLGWSMAGACHEVVLAGCSRLTRPKGWVGWSLWWRKMGAGATTGALLGEKRSAQWLISEVADDHGHDESSSGDA